MHYYASSHLQCNRDDDLVKLIKFMESDKDKNKKVHPYNVWLVPAENYEIRRWAPMVAGARLIYQKDPGFYYEGPKVGDELTQELVDSIVSHPMG